MLTSRESETSGQIALAEAGRRARRAPGEDVGTHPGQGSALRLDVDIRRLTYVDMPDIIAIERRSFPAPWSLAMFVLELSKPSSICLGAIHRGELIGYLICSRYHTVWHLMNVAVDERYRRRGVASALIDRLFAETGDRRDRRSGDRYTLEVRVSNSEAIKMYESLGFRSAGMRRRYYHDNGEDALIMWRTDAGDER